MTGQLTWLVTGCSSGLGASLARSILAKGDRVIATARANESSVPERLASLKEAGAAVLEIDVTAPQAVLDAKAKDAWGIYGHVDVLVNNAAYIDAGVIEDIDEEFLIKVLRNNALGPINLTRALLPYMRARKSGSLLFMSSVGAYYGSPCAGSYSASKGLLEGIVPCLSLEVAPFGIRTCLVIPGYFRTSVMAPGNIKFEAPHPQQEYVEMTKLIKAHCDGADGNQPGDPDKAAALIVNAVRGEGDCQGKALPARLPIGADGFQAVKNNCEEKLKICEDWEQIASSTNIEVSGAWHGGQDNILFGNSAFNGC